MRVMFEFRLVTAINIRLLHWVIEKEEIGNHQIIWMQFFRSHSFSYFDVNVSNSFIGEYRSKLHFILFLNVKGKSKAKLKLHWGNMRNSLSQLAFQTQTLECLHDSFEQQPPFPSCP